MNAPRDHVHNEIIHRWQGGQSLRGIARDLAVSRWQVSETIRRHRAARADGSVDSSNSALPPPAGQRGSKLDAFEPLISQLLERYPRLTATRLFEELKTHGYTGGYTIVRQRLKQQRGRPHKPLVERFETAPGAQAQMDWDEYQMDFTLEGRRRVNLFSYLLGYSRRQYICLPSPRHRAHSAQQSATTTPPLIHPSRNHPPGHTAKMARAQTAIDI
jgi:transposase